MYQNWNNCMPFFRFQHCAVAVGDVVFIFGGANALVDPATGRLPQGGQHFSDLHAFHTSKILILDHICTVGVLCTEAQSGN